MRFSLRLIGDRMNEREVRYHEAGDSWQIAIYRYGEATERCDGRLGYQPEWLQRILDVAKVGGYMPPMRDGPPDRLLWAKIDKDFNLLEITFP